MRNERLRQAIKEAGLEPEQLADLVEVDIRTVDRWLGGRPPYPRLRAKVARALGREEYELWPDKATAPEADRAGGDEIRSSRAHADDPGAPDWRELLKNAIAEVELVDYSLLDLFDTDGTVEALAAKARAGCQVRIVISAPDSIWVRARAHALGQHDEDYIGRSQLALEIETTRGYLEPLTRVEGIELQQLYADPGCRILRFDDQMLISPHLHATPSTHAPVLHLRRRQTGGVFDQYAGHLDALAGDTGRTIEPAPDFYPDPRTHHDRYEPLTADAYKSVDELRIRELENAKRNTRPIEQVRAEIRRPDAGPADAR